MTKETAMDDKLTAYLISMAQNEQTLAQFIQDPIGEAIKAGVPPGQAEILRTRDANKIFAQLEKAPTVSKLVWIVVVP
jgi:hypothetical protein